MKYLVITVLLMTAITVPGLSQKQMNASEIKLELKKLNNLCRVLYVAAHPDDENTRVIAYMANEEMARTAYLSLTRGDGGQNLVGSEKGSYIGVLRTQELLAARRIDRGEQFFTRAVDFGYSKTADETFDIWNHQEVLEDVVWTIRKFRPDVIITRFPPNEKAGHGHHTASAILAEEAFEKAADPKAFPEQLKYVSVWQPTRMFFNSSTWWDPELALKAQTDPDLTTVDVGKYNPLLGKSYAEIAAESRTMHKSQGFGTEPLRGSTMEYLKWIKGEPFERSVFDGIDKSWDKLEGGREIGKLLSKAYKEFDTEYPENVIPVLMEARALISGLDNTYWRQVKLRDIEDLILSCAGVWLEAVAAEPNAAAYEPIVVETFAVNRSAVPVTLKSVDFGIRDTSVSLELKNNNMMTFKTTLAAPGYQNTNPYWLNADYNGLFRVEEIEQIGLPENRPNVEVTFSLTLNGSELTVVRPLVYKYTDRVKGEIYQPFVVLPDVTANFAESVYVFRSGQSKDIVVSLSGHKPDVTGKISLVLPEGWRSEPANRPFVIETKGQEHLLTFRINPGQKPEGSVKLNLSNIDGPVKSLRRIEYDHIPMQTLLPEAEAKVVKLEVAVRGSRVGYITGAGDDVPFGLEQLGYTVTILDENELKNGDLSKYDAIVCGIRAYNINNYLAAVHPRLMDYIRGGGNYIVQYNTNRGLETDVIGPYPFTLSRDRVTVENAAPTFLNPDHPVLNTPNKITESDFDNWIQERGLYFPDSWDEKFTPIIGWNDPGEDMKKGSLIVAPYGDGYFIYTGISFFRQLPAGVPGAFKLIANLLSIGK